MAKRKRKSTGTPLAVMKPPKPIGKMTERERDAFADKVFDGIAKARKPAR